MSFAAGPWTSLFAFGSSGVRQKRRRQGRGANFRVERLEVRTLLAVTATFNLTGSSVVTASDDYFAIEQNNPLDYSEAQSGTAGADDRRNAGFDDTGLTGISLTGGQYNFTTASAPQIYFLHPGFSDSELQATDRKAGVVPEENSGESIPIDTSKYYVLNMKITADGVADPALVGGAAVQGNIQWYDGRAVPTNTATRAFFLFPGTNVYSFNLKTISTASNASGGWTGNISGLRLFPSNTPGVSMHIDWVTLTGENQSPVGVSLTNPSGNAAVGLSTDGDPTHLVKFIRPAGNTDGDFIVRTNLVSATTPGSISTIQLPGLAAGTYFLHALDSFGSVLTGTVAQQITVNGIPRASVTDPNNRGDESNDYATSVRGNAWDFSESTDFVMPSTSDGTNYGTPTIVTNPVTSQGGALTGTWMRYDNMTASASHVGDPQFQLALTSPIDPAKYTNLTIRLLIDRPRDVGLGSVLRVFWSESTPEAEALAGRNFVDSLVQSDDIIVENGVQEIHIDLSKVKIEPHSTGTKAWSASSLIRYLRIDPHEFGGASDPIKQAVVYVDDVKLTQHDHTTSNQFNVTWQTTDGDSNPVTLSSIKLDPDRNRGNGNETTIATNPGNVGLFAFDKANFSSLALGSYNVLLTFSDGRNTSFRYSTGVLDVKADGPSGDPTLARVYRAYNPNANFHFFTTSKAQFDNAVQHGYRDESTGQSSFEIHTSQVTNSTPLYRLYNLQRGFHYYTLSLGEKNSLVAIVPPPASGPDTRTVGWRDEGAEGYMYSTQQSGTTEIFRLYNKDSGVHLFTHDLAVKNSILAAFPLSWVQHSSVGYAFAVGAAALSAEGASAPAVALAATAADLSPTVATNSGVIAMGFVTASGDSHEESDPSGSSLNVATPLATEPLAQEGPGTGSSSDAESVIAIAGPPIADVNNNGELPAEPDQSLLDSVWAELGRNSSELSTMLA